MEALVIINEQHTLLPDQERILLEKFGAFELVKVPATGWTLEQIEEVCASLTGIVVFVSPIPAMIKILARRSGQDEGRFDGEVGDSVFVFHNDHREKKALPDGRVIMTVAQDGWVLV